MIGDQVVSCEFSVRVFFVALGGSRFATARVVCFGRGECDLFPAFWRMARSDTCRSRDCPKFDFDVEIEYKMFFSLV
jgi:hypothetical protein